MTIHDFKSLDEIPFNSHRFVGNFTKRQYSKNVERCYSTLLESCFDYREQSINDFQLVKKCEDMFEIPVFHNGDGIVRGISNNSFIVEMKDYDSWREGKHIEPSYNQYSDIFASRKEQIDSYNIYVENEFQMFQKYLDEHHLCHLDEEQKAKEESFLNEIIVMLKKEFL